MLKALCESRSVGSRVISEVRYLGQEGVKGPLEGGSRALALLSASVKFQIRCHSDLLLNV